ncbi:hypothetical protein K1719_023323 [Acacia pycnantha]|nr:hypothetical protein K1719_023323 [Acacia pycnantha]
MDSVINASLEEICSQLQNGLPLAALWPRLQPVLSASNLDLSPGVKKAIWTNLLRIPTLRFEVKNEACSPGDPSIQSFEDAEKLNLKIVSQRNLRDNFLGLYESNSLVPNQMRALELLANARSHGITQSQISKQLRIEGNNLHYVLRSLECQGLIVKQSALERKKETCADGELKNLPCVSTNLVYLHRYAKQLGSHQRFEITTAGQKLKNQEDANGNSGGEMDVLIKDYAPQMKAICGKLAKANGKVLVVSDIKRDLGYCKSPSKHKAWREILRRLKADNVVEQFDAKVNGKVEACLRLLDPTNGSENGDKNLNSGKKCLVMEQFVELPIEHQIFDMIDASGSDGISLKEISERLRIDLKKNHSRLLNMCYRFGMKVQEEQCQKSKTIRVWTSRNFNPESEAMLILKPDENTALVPNVSSSSAIMTSANTDPISNGDPAGPRLLEDTGTNAKLSCGSTGNIERNNFASPLNLQGFSPEGTVSGGPRDLVCATAEGDVASTRTLPPDVSNSTWDLVSATSEGDVAPTRTPPPDVSKLFFPGPNQSFSFSVNSTKRAKRILERLEDEKFILRPEMHRWLNSLEKDKCFKMDRKTIDRILKKLQEQGLCKLITVYVPVVTKYSGQKQWVVVVHPSINLSPELFDKIQEKARSFDGYVRSQGTSQRKDDESIPVMEDLQKTQSSTFPDERPGKAEAMRANGFVLAKMIRAKILHSFLWDYIKEYRSLMDTHATGRMSLVIDILRRLKLIRVATDLQSRDGVMTPCALTHMMELKPYMEEPLSNDASCINFISVDLRPRIRHDFVLSNRDAVDEYWQTLEYCYAAADQKAASLAFPGTVVPEVFRFRSWASIHVMTSEQRAELLKRVMENDSIRKISYKDCEKIAKDLNLTLEQVLSMYTSKHRYQVNENRSSGQKVRSSRRRKKGSPKSRLAKHAQIDSATDIGGIRSEEDAMCIDSGEHTTHMLEFREDNHHETEDTEDGHSLINQCVLSKMKPRRQRRFTWSDETDRRLVIQYVKNRAVLGPKYHRTSWGTLPDLPAPPITCQKRINSLNRNLRFRKAVMGLCNLLAERYAKHLEETQNLSLKNGKCRQLVRCPSKEVVNNFTHNVETQATSLNGEAWDDFENRSIKIAFNEVLRCKKIAELEASSVKNRSQNEGWSVANEHAEGYDVQENEVTPSVIPSECIQSHHGKNLAFSSQRSCRRRLDKKFIRFFGVRANVNQQVHESLAVSNLVELFKLVFLSTSTNPQASNLLADILRRYSEHDLFAAFNYLREKKIMIGGNGTQPFELSQHFLHGISKSPFPLNTGRRAIKFSTWLHERAKDLTNVGANLAEDLECGDIFHLFALVSSGELSISPCLPDNGVGEAEDMRNTKRKADVCESLSGDKAKKLKSIFGVEGEVISRREKGFPGIVISARCATISGADTIDLFKDKDTINNGQPFEGIFQLNKEQSCDYSPPEHMLEIFNSCETVSIEENDNESSWDAMVGYARRLMAPSNQEQTSVISAEVFRDIHAAIQKAGDQGLSMEEVSRIINFPGVDVDGIIVDVLEAFGQALKVNAYASVRVVDALYRCKYSLPTVSGFHQAVQLPSSIRTIEKSDGTRKPYELEKQDNNHANLPREGNNSTDQVHKVTILNLPSGALDSENETRHKDKGFMQDQAVLPRVNCEKETAKISSGESRVPILPWINGDGTVNQVVFKGLKRRVLGIVMQNPGMLEDAIIHQMQVLNPQSCRTLLEIMVLDRHLIVRKMQQNRPVGFPSLLQNLSGVKSNQEKVICRSHFFANPMSSSLL